MFRCNLDAMNTNNEITIPLKTWYVNCWLVIILASAIDCYSCASDTDDGCGEEPDTALLVATQKVVSGCPSCLKIFVFRGTSKLNEKVTSCLLDTRYFGGINRFLGVEF